MKQNKLYPESGVELTPFIARNYDRLMNMLTFGKYRKFIHQAIRDLKMEPGNSILDLGCGTGRNSSIVLKQLSNSGSIVGVDVSSIMQSQFEKRFRNDKRAIFLNQRIDIPFDLNQTFDVVFISFVIHGFPHEVRKTIIENAKSHLKPGGTFAILDFAEFGMEKMPAHHRWIFKKIECPYAFDYIKRDWKNILSESGFSKPTEHFYFKNYLRLLTVNYQ